MSDDSSKAAKEFVESVTRYCDTMSKIFDEMIEILKSRNKDSL